MGAHRAGFHVAAAFDNDPILSSSYPSNFPNTRLFLRDVATLTGDDLTEAAGGQIHGIFGGPPCQGFSTMGKRDPADPRRELLDHFFRLVSEAKPTFFVMENVTGLGAASSIGILNNALLRVKKEYFLLGPCIWDASEFGAATKRPRLFVIGVRRGISDPITLEDINSQKRPAASVKTAIGDLKGAIEEGEQNGFDYWRIIDTAISNKYIEKLRAPDLRFTGHRPTCHTAGVIERFAKVAPGSIDGVGRHPRLSWDGQCPTLRAGTGADRGSYQSVRPIHPDLPRVITVREAARLQGFPDSHLFHPTVWHSFRMIGNSVSPIIAEAIFSAIAQKVSCSREGRIAIRGQNGSLNSGTAVLADVEGCLEEHIGRETGSTASACARATV